jgi:hypothetical protein
MEVVLYYSPEQDWRNFPLGHIFRQKPKPETDRMTNLAWEQFVK